MRTSTYMAMVIAGILGFSSIAMESKAQRVSVNFSVFQNELGRYGRWMQHPRYGEVWIYNEPGFRPYYSNGNWDYTEYGWEWISDYDWGWAPFHYGRWELDPYYGWVWIPGYEWAPAWVSWSEYGDYYGWAPLGFGLSININIRSIAYDRWTFCSRPYINNRGFRNYCVPFSQNRNIYNNVTIINNYYGQRNGRYSMGPDRRDVERYYGRNIEAHHYDRDNRYQRRDDDRENRRYANNDNRNGYGRGNGRGNGNGNNNGNRNGDDNRNNNGFDNRNGNANNRDFNPRNNENERRYREPMPDNNRRENNNPGNRDIIDRPYNNENNRNGNGSRTERPENNRSPREFNPGQRGGDERRYNPAREERNFGGNNNPSRGVEPRANGNGRNNGDSPGNGRGNNQERRGGGGGRRDK